MIPWIRSETFVLAGITFRTWGTFVALGFTCAAWLAYRRAKRAGLAAERVWDLAFWVLLCAIIGARLFHVAFYDLAHYLAHPLDIVNPLLPGYAMFGGWLGGALAFFAYVRKQRLAFLPFADAFAFAIPLGIGIGRLGCFLIHDHPGLPTTFLLGMQYPDGIVRHDLGLYLSLIGFATVLGFVWLSRKGSQERAPGFWLACLMLVEAVTRFFLDFLRIADARWLMLTPTQWLSVPLFFGGLWLILRRVRVA
ncbi:MAG: prolipoprotein diacylglyceryl transferase [Patescibacteria group bacterium]